MILADFHTHSCFSTDSESRVEDMLSIAESKGLSYLCLTDHIDLDYPGSTPKQPLFHFSPTEYFEALSPLKHKNQTKVSLLLGVEFGLRPHRPDLNAQMNQILKDYPFDFVLGSLHLIQNIDPFYPEFWNNRTAEDTLTLYFDELLTSITEYQNFDSLSHFDYVLRYIPKELGEKKYSYEMYQTVIDNILKLIIFREQALEINTKGFLTDLNSFHPNLSVLDRYLELGGTLFTIGSDAHATKHIALEYKKTRELLLSHGVTKYCIYQNRKPEYLSL